MRSTKIKSSRREYSSIMKPHINIRFAQNLPQKRKNILYSILPSSFSLPLFLSLSLTLFPFLSPLSLSSFIN